MKTDWMRAACVSVGIAAVLLSSAGCATSPWKAEFVASGEAAPAAAHGGPVRVREVPWERVQTTLQQLQADWAASDVPPEEWTEAQRLERRAKLLRGLQVTSDARYVDVLGRSEFRTTDRVRPDDGQLEAFARRVGATTVVWSSAFMGKADVVRSEPVTEWRSGSFNGWRDNDRGGSFAENSTIFVPIVLQADQRAWVAYFLRERGETVSSAGSGAR